MADSHQAAKSSMFDLKAELVRKQEEYKKFKAQNAADFVKGKTIRKHGKKDPWSKQNAGVLERASMDMEKKQEEDNIMERSRKALEAKSKIYEKIASASGIPDDDGSEGYLVDFQKKAVDRIVEERRGNIVTPSGAHDPSDDDSTNDEPIPEPKDAGEEWVDYVDTSGRSKRCMKKDLPHLETQQQPLEKQTTGLDGLKLKEGATLLSADMKRELRRQKWEKEAQETANGPIHYANVQFDEIRTHGTGFFQFSKDNNLRAEQMDMLSKLRDQTIDSHEKSMRIKEKRKAALEARLAKVKQRRKMKDGSLLGLDSKDEDEKPTEEIPQSVEKEPEPLTRDDSWRQNAPVREWDLGKPKLPEWNAKRYMEQKRLERESEFAPPQFYYDKQNFQKAGQSARSQGIAGGPVGKTQTLAKSSTVSSTDIMLKQIRNSFGASIQAHTAGARSGVKGTAVGQVGASEDNSVTHSLGYLDPAAIPLPCEATAGQPPNSATGESGKDGKESDQLTHPFPSAGQGLACTQGQVVEGGVWGQGCFQGSGVFGQAVDVSVPPPGWHLPPQPLQTPGVTGQSQVLPPLAWSMEPQTTTSGNEKPEAATTMHQPPTTASAFRYPSQQGLLFNPQPQSRKTPEHTAAPTAPTPLPSAAPSVKTVVPMVDKRFMQNKEVSEEDLLGYMASGGSQPLASMEAVSYTPGIFSSTEAQSQQVSEENPGPPVPLADSSLLPTSSCQTQDSTSPAGQTQGVIFGVPDFLQPAPDVAAKVYQPGSFMAAKAQAAQKAELEYEAARKKQSYSSAPILYSQLPDRQTGKEPGCSGVAEQSGASLPHAQKDNVDDKVTGFLKSLRDGK